MKLRIDENHPWITDDDYLHNISRDYAPFLTVFAQYLGLCGRNVIAQQSYCKLHVIYCKFCKLHPPSKFKIYNKLLFMYLPVIPWGGHQWYINCNLPVTNTVELAASWSCTWSCPAPLTLPLGHTFKFLPRLLSLDIEGKMGRGEHFGKIGCLFTLWTVQIEVISLFIDFFLKKGGTSSITPPQGPWEVEETGVSFTCVLFSAL